ncbi:MAG: class I SAM-dependent methyltransferase [Bacteroidales bacterium]|nr:class I SAM-dependent methyltransferase [Bacteroidales bacterium]
MRTLSDHWDKIFTRTAENKLGWYENDFSQTLKFLALIPAWKNATVFIPGVGTSGLIDILAKSDTRLILNDLSREAIEKAKKKYGDNNIQWLCQDISRALPAQLEKADIWLDRAVLHFLVDDGHVEQYFKNVDTLVKPGGHAIFAEFSKKGATKCAGLDVRRYGANDLKQHLPAFELLAEEEYTYTNPGGDPRPYIYTLFKRKIT